MLELAIAAATAGAFVLVILLTSAPRSSRVPPTRPRREHETVQALNAFGDDADRIFR